MRRRQYLIIRNRDMYGALVRPRNWADRLAGTAADYVDGRLIYDSRIVPCRACEGMLCLRVDRTVFDAKPYLQETVETFMQIHDIPEYTDQCPRVRREAELAGAQKESEDDLLVA